jgi:peptidyl-prolyl cis-trans isomerase C
MHTRMLNPWPWILFLLVTVVPFMPAMAATQPLPDNAVAVVNGVVISQADLDRALNQVRQKAQFQGQQLDPARLAEIKKSLTERLVQQELLYQESRRIGIAIDTGAVDKQIAQMQERFASQAEFQNALAKMDLSLKELRSQIERNLAVQRLLDEQILQKVTVTGEESKAFYEDNPNYFKQPEQVRASHILIKVDPKADAAELKKARQKIEAVQERLRADEDFAELARELSEGPSAAQGGDLGFFDRRQMVKPFADAAFALKPGEVSDVVQTRFGYHLIKVVDRKPESKLAYDEIRERLEESLKQQKAEKQLAVYLENLQQKATIETR